MERELFNSCIVLKNLAMVHQDMPMSGDFILEQLMECSKSLKNVYADKSLITTMAATATIFAMLLNFTIVVVFMDALKMVEQIF